MEKINFFLILSYFFGIISLGIDSISYKHNYAHNENSTKQIIAIVLFITTFIALLIGLPIAWYFILLVYIVINFVFKETIAFGYLKMLSSGNLGKDYLITILISLVLFIVGLLKK